MLSLKRWAVLTLCLGTSAPIFGHKGEQHNVGQVDPAKRGSAPIVQEETRWGADYFPNVPLVTHEGKTVRFFDDMIKDKVVVINFIYTSCTDACPGETAKLVQLQRILGDRVGQDVFMYSITIDPKHDTPKVLKEYKEKFKVAPGWLFLTGQEADITLLRRKLGLYRTAVEEGTRDHSLSLIIGNQKTGQWMKRSPFENNHFLSEQIGSWLHGWKKPPIVKNSYADAPTVRKFTNGENLFQTRCTACHTIGGGKARSAATQNLGPDLLGVTERRERAWLARWVANPDKMLAEKDPLALKIYAQYNQMPMPNLGLSAREVAEVIDYMEDESHKVKAR